ALGRGLRARGGRRGDGAARTDEYVKAMRALWDEPVPSFEGRFVSFSGLIQRPRPVHQPHPPIVVGGHSPAAYRRAVQTANGWYGWTLGLEETARALGDLREAATRYERPAALGPLEITITPPRMVDLDTPRRYVDLGVPRLAT